VSNRNSFAKFRTRRDHKHSLPIYAVFAISVTTLRNYGAVSDIFGKTGICKMCTELIQHITESLLHSCSQSHRLKQLKKSRSHRSFTELPVCSVFEIRVLLSLRF
jgi:hypothetical protein